jgi:hypothetical protein
MPDKKAIIEIIRNNKIINALRMLRTLKFVIGAEQILAFLHNTKKSPELF